MSSGMKVHLLWAHGGKWVKEIIGEKKRRVQVWVGQAHSCMSCLEMKCVLFDKLAVSNSSV